MAHDTRDSVVDFVRDWSEKTEVPVTRMIGWLAIGTSKYYDWKARFGKINEHNALIPRDHWLEEWENKAIIEYYVKHALEGYRRLTFMMLDANVVAVSASSVYRVLKGAGLLGCWKGKESKKGTGFVQPLKAHEHWHIDITYLNMGGTFYYLCSVLDGYSRMILHWEMKAGMTEQDVEVVLQKTREQYPDAKPRIISDNGPQFIAGDFKEFIRLTGMTHVRTSPYYPQSNGKKERYFKSYKSEAWRPGQASNVEEAHAVTERYVKHYNEVRLHSAICYLTPKDKLEGREKQIYDARDLKLAQARESRKEKRAIQAVELN